MVGEGSINESQQRGMRFIKITSTILFFLSSLLLLLPVLFETGLALSLGLSAILGSKTLVQVAFFVFLTVLPAALMILSTLFTLWGIVRVIRNAPFTRTQKLLHVVSIGVFAAAFDLTFGGPTLGVRFLIEFSPILAFGYAILAGIFLQYVLRSRVSLIDTVKEGM